MPKETEYCSCQDIQSVHTETDDFYQWDVCDKCNKPIEDSMQSLNHYDGEDHTIEY